MAATPNLGLICYGGNTAQIDGQTNVDKYSTIILSPFKFSGNSQWTAQLRTLYPDARILMYKASADMTVESGDSTLIRRNSQGGVTYNEAINHDAANPTDQWVLRDSSGNPVVAYGFANEYLGDITKASFRARWVSNVVDALTAAQVDGLFVDNILGYLGGSGPPVGFDDASWGDAMEAFILDVGPQIQTAGFYIMCNAFGGLDNDGLLDAAWWQRILPGVDGAMCEFWMTGAFDITRPRYDALDFQDNVRTWKALADTAYALGKDFHGDSVVYASDTLVKQYTRASWLLKWDGTSTGCSISAMADGSDAWHPTFAIDPGLPETNEEEINGAGTVVAEGTSSLFRRFYSKGIVLQNTHPTNTYTITDLGDGRSYFEGDGVTPVSLPFTLGPAETALLTTTDVFAGGSAPPPAWSKIAGGNSARGDGTTARTITLDGPVAVGDVVVVSSARLTSTDDLPLDVCTDDLGNTYTPLGSGYDSADLRGLSWFYCVVEHAGTPTITVDYPAAQSVPVFEDNFDDNSLDTTKWVLGVFGGGTYTETGGVAQFDAPVQGSGSSLDTVDTHDMTGRAFSVDVVDIGSQADGHEGGIKVLIDDNNLLIFFAYLDQWWATKIVAGVNTLVATVPRDPTHNYWRIRESNGITYWETSADRVTWTAFHSEANPIAVTAVKFRFYSITYPPYTGAAQMKFDNAQLASQGFDSAQAQAQAYRGGSANPLDIAATIEAFATSSGSGADNAVVGTATTSGDSELVVVTVAAVDGSTFTPGTGYTADQGSGTGMLLEHLEQGVAGPVTGKATMSGASSRFVGGMATFKAAQSTASVAKVSSPAAAQGIGLTLQTPQTLTVGRPSSPASAKGMSPQFESGDFLPILGADFPEICVEVAFDSKPRDFPQVWTPITGYVRQFSSGPRGKRPLVDRPEAASISLTLDNADRTFDETYAAGPFFGKLKPNKRARIRMRWAGVVYPIIEGLVNDWPQSWPGSGKDAIVSVTATDKFKMMGRFDLPADYTRPVERSGASIRSILDAAGQQGPELDLAVGHALIEAINPPIVFDGTLAGGSPIVTGIATTEGLQTGMPVTGTGIPDGTTIQSVDDRQITLSVAATVSGVETITATAASPSSIGNALEVAQKVATSERGLLFVAADGKWRFQDRTFRLNQTSLGVFGDGPGELPYTDVVPAFTEQDVANDVHVTHPSGEQIAADETSQDDNGIVSLTIDTLLHDPNDAQSIAYYELSQRKDARTRIDTIQLDGSVDPAALWPVILGLEIGDRYTLKRRPRTGDDPQVYEINIDAIAFTGKPGQLKATVQATPANTHTYWVLGQSRLGSETRLSF